MKLAASFMLLFLVLGWGGYRIWSRQAAVPDWSIEVLPYDLCYASAVSPDGSIVGVSCAGQPFLWQKGKQIVQVKGQPPKSRGAIQSIGYDGRCAGSYGMPGEGARYAYVFANRKLQRFNPFPGADRTSLVALLPDGWIASSIAGDRTTAYRKTGSHLVKLATPDPTFLNVYAVARSLPKA